MFLWCDIHIEGNITSEQPGLCEQHRVKKKTIREYIYIFYVLNKLSDFDSRSNILFIESFEKYDCNFISCSKASFYWNFFFFSFSFSFSFLFIFNEISLLLIWASQYFLLSYILTTTSILYLLIAECMIKFIISRLNLLIASCGKQDIHMFAYGVYPIVVMAVDQINGVTVSIRISLNIDSSFLTFLELLKSV